MSQKQKKILAKELDNLRLLYVTAESWLEDITFEPHNHKLLQTFFDKSKSSIAECLRLKQNEIPLSHREKLFLYALLLDEALSQKEQELRALRRKARCLEGKVRNVLDYIHNDMKEIEMRLEL